MEELVTSRAFLIWKSLLGGDKRIANSTFGVVLESTNDILSECFQAICDRAILKSESDTTQRCYRRDILTAN
jgi:hypothetical protein